MNAADTLLDIETIFLEPTVTQYERGREILARYPEAKLIEVASHWQIPELHGDESLANQWNTVKRTVLVLGVKKGLRCTPYYRNADFIAPSHANGCAMACVYCYVARRKGAANPITTFVNIEQISAAIRKHAVKQGPKLMPNEADPTYWAYEIGTNSDCSVDARLSDNVRDLIALFRDLPHAMATFATKHVNRDLLTFDPQGKTRIRVSLMPPGISKIVDVRTSPVLDRVALMSDLVAAGYDVNISFGPVIYDEGWQADYRDLFRAIDDQLSSEAKAKLVADVIFLTHNEQLHEVNLRWHPKAEAILWRPELQEEKISQAGGRNLRYKLGFKGGLVRAFRALLEDELPYCRIRYAF